MNDKNAKLQFTKQTKSRQKYLLKITGKLRFTNANLLDKKLKSTVVHGFKITEFLIQQGLTISKVTNGNVAILMPTD